MPDSPSFEKFLPENLTVSDDDKNLHHVFDEEDCYALWAAYAAGRPLLVRGKPGTGKTQMAQAIAAQLGWAFVSETIRASTELSDLHWHFDAIGRLGEAQAMGIHSSRKPVRSLRPDRSSSNKLNPLNYLSPGAFWWAYDWETAEKKYNTCNTHLRPKPDSKDHAHQQGVVLLIDEIDKAEPDLPNGLLETLGHYQFSVPYIDDKDPQSPFKNPITASKKKPLVIITTNEERELPTAFVRRCFVHTLKMEDNADWLIKRGKLHFKNDIADEVYTEAASQLLKDRAAAHTRYPPGLAEYIDLLAALKDLDKAEQYERLKKIASYALEKEVAD